jgi:hypothetical protein
MRWIAAQIRYGLSSIGNAFIHLMKYGNVDYFDKSFQFLLLPRLLLLGSLVIVLAFCLIMQWTSIGIFSISILIVFILTLLLAMPLEFYSKATLRALIMLPQLFILMLIAGAGYRKASSNFLHTPHQVTSKS